MDKSEILSNLREMIVERLFLSVKPEELDPAASLIDVYGVDSVCLLELVVGLEDRFGIIIEDGDFNVKNFETVNAIAEFVSARL